MKKYIKSAIQPISESDIYTKISIAGDPNTPSEVLSDLSSDPNILVRYLVSKNPSTPEGTATESFSLGDVDPNITLELAVDFWVYSDTSIEELNRLSNCVSDTIKSCGYEVDHCEVVENYDDEEGEDSDIKYMTMVAKFTGCDDDHFVLSNFVQNAVWSTFRDNGYEVSYSEYF